MFVGELLLIERIICFISGYLAQPHPVVGEGIVERKVCFGDADQCCTTSREVLVKNCGTHFVYRYLLAFYLWQTYTTEEYYKMGNLIKLLT